MASNGAPEKFKEWVKGFEHRVDSLGKPIELSFRDIEGRDIDLQSMRGKVVLVEFWATWCGPCVEELPKIKDTYAAYHAKGLEILGLTCDGDVERLKRFVRKTGIPWPQYFDGQSQVTNRFTRDFGIDAIPHIFLVDKRGRLRFDNLRATDPGFTAKLEQLLQE